MNKEYHNRQEVTGGDLGVIAGGIAGPASETTLDNALGGWTMSKVKIEAFLSVPTCSGGISLSRLLREIEEE